MTTKHRGEEKNLQGEALKAERFKMLADIATELQEKVIFPMSFDVTMNIRNALLKSSPPERLRQLVPLDPLVGAKLLRMANSKARRHKQPPVADLKKALTLLNDEAIRQAATDISTPQLLRSRFLADFADWIELLWDRSLGMAATAHVLAKKFTDVDPEHALFAALCHEMPLYYMLYRAVQYPELRARPASLKHLVINWHDGIAESLLTALKLPQEIIDAATGEGPSPLPIRPKTLGDIIHISKELSGPLVETNSTPFCSALHAHYLDEQGEIQGFRRNLRALIA